MQKYADAVILMQMNSKELKLLNTSGDWNIQSFVEQKPTIPFSDEVIEYLNTLSKELNQNKRIKSFPDVATFSFYCRKSNILQLKKKFNNNEQIKLGLGVLFHIAPSNVAINFAYSLVVGLLSGNLNIVRVPSKYFEQVEMVAKAIKAISKSKKHKAVSNRIVLVNYDSATDLTKSFSSVCDVRVIWGGDETILRIRENKLKPRAFDLTFADRYSICIINSDKYIEEKNYKQIASGFFNDTYLFDQNACTSPHLIIWVGNKSSIEKGQFQFWETLYFLAKNNYQLASGVVIDKLTNLFDHAISAKGLKLKNNKDNLLWRVHVDELQSNIDEFRCNSGYFAEYYAEDLKEIEGIINKKYQTLAYYGFANEELKNLIKDLKPNGIDRIVPIGKTMDFSLIWDGYDLINKLSRTIEIL